MSEPEMKIVGKLHGLKTFSLRSSADADMIVKFLSYITTLHLDRLSFCIGDVNVEQSKQVLAALKSVSFKTLVIADSSHHGSIPEEFKEQIVKGLKGREVIFIDGRSSNQLPDAWFSYRYVDPATLGVW